MSLILHIETATTVCSAAVSRGDTCLAFRESKEGYTHAEKLHPFIDSLLHETAISPNQLAAIAVSRGPGSYTGLRIGASAAKGLAFALGIPLIAVDTLRLMASGAARETKAAALCPMIDARRMEVYTAVYDGSLTELSPVEALIIDEKSVRRLHSYPSIAFFGNGMAKSREVLSVIPGSSFIDDIVPHAQFMPALAWPKFLAKEFEDVSAFEPFYLKEFMAKAPRTSSQPG